jgi:hypothetical protein
MGYQISPGVNHRFVPLTIILSPVSLVFGSQADPFSLDCRVRVTVRVPTWHFLLAAGSNTPSVFARESWTLAEMTFRELAYV